MEKDPLIPQRMRDVSRELCPDEVHEFMECGKKVVSFYQYSVYINFKIEGFFADK